MYLPHTQYTITTFDMGLSRTNEANESLWRLLHDLGACSVIKGKCAEAEVTYQRKLQLQETVLGKDCSFALHYWTMIWPIINIRVSSSVDWQF
jgi:hypothetical protein